MRSLIARIREISVVRGPAHSNTVLHLWPAWKFKGDAVVLARINEDEPDARMIWEELWCRKISETAYELCCIPFFRYEDSLGDVLECMDSDIGLTFATGLVSRSGHLSYRVFVSEAGDQEEIIRTLGGFGCQVEQRWPGSMLLSADVESGESGLAVVHYLDELEQSGQAEYASSRTLVSD